eukprot:gene13831-29425_t
MDEFADHYSMVINLPIDGKNRGAFRNILSNMLSANSNVGLSKEVVHLDDDHVEFTIVSNDDICLDFYKRFIDGFNISIPIPIPLFRDKNEMSYLLIETNQLRDVILGRENEFLKILEERYPVLQLKWVDGGLDIYSADKLSLKSFENYMMNLIQNPSTIDDDIFSSYKFNMNVTSLRDVLSINHWKYLERQHQSIKFEIKINEQTNEDILYCKTNLQDKQNADIFKEIIRNILLEPTNFLQEISNQKMKKIHIFVDVSNISIGIQTLPDGSKNCSIQLNIENLTNLIINERNVQSAIAVGSSIEKESKAKLTVPWITWEKSGFKTIIKQRGLQGEQTVDEVLHAQISRETIGVYRKEDERTFVILTGDGNINHKHGTNFPQIILDAMRNHRTVELWSWKRCINQIYCSEEFKVDYSP